MLLSQTEYQISLFSLPELVLEDKLYSNFISNREEPVEEQVFTTRSEEIDVSVKNTVSHLNKDNLSFNVSLNLSANSALESIPVCHVFIFSSEIPLLEAKAALLSSLPKMKENDCLYCNLTRSEILTKQQARDFISRELVYSSFKEMIQSVGKNSQISLKSFTFIGENREVSDYFRGETNISGIFNYLVKEDDSYLTEESFRLFIVCKESNGIFAVWKETDELSLRLQEVLEREIKAVNPILSLDLKDPYLSLKPVDSSQKYTKIDSKVKFPLTFIETRATKINIQISFPTLPNTCLFEGK